MTFVSRSNDGEEGEMSATERAKKRKDQTDSLAVARSIGRRYQVAGRDYKHQDQCQNCFDGGEIVICDYCPAAYHVDCLEEPPPETGRWSCPHHKCFDCGRNTTAAGLLFRCEVCPRAYCEDCLALLDQKGVQTIGASPRYSTLGYNTPSNVCFVVCSVACAANAIKEKFSVADLLTPALVALAKREGTDAEGMDIEEKEVEVEFSKVSREVDFDFLESCKLGDIFTRLNRMHLSQTEICSRYKLLQDIYGFKSQFPREKAAVKSVLYEVLKSILNPFGINIDSYISKEVIERRYREEADVKEESKAKITASLSHEDGDDLVDQDAVNDQRLMEIESAVLNFPGIPLPPPKSEFASAHASPTTSTRRVESTSPAESSKSQSKKPLAPKCGSVSVTETLSLDSLENNSYNAAMVEAMRAGLQVLSTTNPTTLHELANALCVVQMGIVNYTQSEKKNFVLSLGEGNEHKHPYKEPKFRHFSPHHGSVSRSRIEEAIVCFLVTLLPANQLVSLSKSTRDARLQKKLHRPQQMLTISLRLFCT